MFWNVIVHIETQFKQYAYYDCNFVCRHVVERHVTEKHPEKRPFVISVRERDPEAESSSETDTREGGIAGAQLTTEGLFVFQVTVCECIILS